MIETKVAESGLAGTGRHRDGVARFSPADAAAGRGRRALGRALALAPHHPDQNCETFPHFQRPRGSKKSCRRGIFWEKKNG